MGVERFIVFNKVVNPGYTITSVNGIWQVGQTLALTVNPGYTASGQQWVRSNPDGTNPTDIAGQTGTTYVLTNSDIGYVVSARVTGLSYVPIGMSIPAT